MNKAMVKKNNYAQPGDFISISGEYHRVIDAGQNSLYIEDPRTKERYYINTIGIRYTGYAPNTPG